MLGLPAANYPVDSDAVTPRLEVTLDVYRPQQASASMALGEKSVALRLVLSSELASLTDEAIDAAVQAVLESLQSSLQARLRA